MTWWLEGRSPCTWWVPVATDLRTGPLSWPPFVVVHSQGYAYIPEEAIGSLVMSIFRKNLSRALVVSHMVGV